MSETEGRVSAFPILEVPVIVGPGLLVVRVHLASSDSLPVESVTLTTNV